MGGRLPKPVGTFGVPTKPKRQKNGRWRTTVRFYSAWGPRQIERMGSSADEARNRLAEAMRNYSEQHGHARITCTTKLIDLAAELLAEMERDDAYTAGNIEDYRREIYVSHDKRADPTTVKVENSVGRLQIWQAGAGELDRHLKRLVAMGLRRKAKQHKIILRAMMGIAVRHGVIDTNPIDDVAPFTRRRSPARGKIRDHSALPAFRAQVRAWASGEAIPGTPAYTRGPSRDWTVVWIVDVITGTGMRPHEVFALLLADINLDAVDPYLDVTGTLVEVKGAGTGGWLRKPTPKSDNGWRRILLPDRTVEAIREAMKDLEVTARPDPRGCCSRPVTARRATRTTSVGPGVPPAGTTSPGSPRAPSAKARPPRSTTPTATPNAPPANSATPARSPRPTTSTHPRSFPTTARSLSAGRGAGRGENVRFL
ncbi:hypothetical protein [Nocardia brevicatena]|uniref:hypothetical protein n=1 Tax=Nocardia brevicatena TaxID=37327 RepID=UPI000309DC86|nr:hypothetical protein [Nocardia brevicatena]